MKKLTILILVLNSQLTFSYPGNAVFLSETISFVSLNGNPNTFSDIQKIVDNLSESDFPLLKPIYATVYSNKYNGYRHFARIFQLSTSVKAYLSIHFHEHLPILNLFLEPERYVYLEFDFTSSFLDESDSFESEMRIVANFLKRFIDSANLFKIEVELDSENNEILEDEIFNELNEYINRRYESLN